MKNKFCYVERWVSFRVNSYDNSLKHSLVLMVEKSPHFLSRRFLMGLPRHDNYLCHFLSNVDGTIIPSHEIVSLLLQ